MLCVTAFYSKYAWVVLLIVWVDSGCKPNKTWVDQGSEFYNRPMKSWLHENGIKMYSLIERKSVMAERFIRALKNNIYKYITAVSKKVYINMLNEIIDKYNNTYHRTIRMKSTNVKSGPYIEHCVEHNDKDPNFKIGDHARISKPQIIFAKSYLNSKLFFLQILFVISMVKILLGHFMEESFK